MQRVASHALHNDHEAKPLSGENCVTHWADRIMPSRTGSPSFEPMSVLSTLSKRNEFKYIPDKGQEKAASNSGSSDSSLSSAVYPPTQSPGFSTPSKSVSDSTSPSVSDEELDTFWAKFVGSTSKQGSMISPLSLDMNASSGLPEPSAFLMQSHHSAPVRVDPDMALMFQQEFGIPDDRLNVNGGSIAIGHPLGSTGARMLTDLLCELERRGGRYALQTICEASGTANTTIIERLE